jgi:predicted nuclease of predicted toxin-antitoxin system
MAPILVDECVPSAVIEVLRELGCPLLLVRDEMCGAPDEEVLGRALGEGLVLITEDRRFGLLALSSAESVAGVIVVSMGDASPSEKADRVRQVWTSICDELAGRLIVVGQTRVRARSLS